MNRISNNIKALLLLLPALAPVIYYSFFLLSQLALRIEMKKELNREDLISIHLKKTTPVNGKEIYVDGKLFDIKKIETLPNGDLVVTGLFDEKESSLHKSLSHNENHDRSKSQLSKVVFQWQSFPPSCYEFSFLRLSITYLAPADQGLPIPPPSAIHIPPPQSC